MTNPFPFHSHLTLKEVGQVELWRKVWDDEVLLFRYNGGKIVLNGRPLADIRAYLYRNQRHEAA